MKKKYCLNFHQLPGLPCFSDLFLTGNFHSTAKFWNALIVLIEGFLYLIFIPHCILSLATVICNAWSFYVCASLATVKWVKRFNLTSNLCDPMGKTVLFNLEKQRFYPVFLSFTQTAFYTR